MIIQTSNISKTFNGIKALSEIDFNIKKGEVHGLVGENGAGKSTLIKILTGVYKEDCGEIFVDGKLVSIKTPIDARNLGINVIHQDRNLVPYFNGVENIYLGEEYEKNALGKVNFKKMKANAEKVMQTYGISFPLKKLARELSPPQKTLLDITRALMKDCKLLILDEPTASLTDKETQVLYEIIKNLQKKGVAVLYITHRLEEILLLSDRITILKNGELSATLLREKTSKEELIAYMTDSHASGDNQSKVCDFGNVLLEAKDIATANKVVKNASFQVREGEILGIFGLGGSGRTEMLEAVYGMEKIQSGDVIIKSEKQKRINPTQSIEHGIALINEDRRGKSIIESFSVKENITLSTIDKYKKPFFFDRKQELQDTKEKISAMKIKCTGAEQPIFELSGGNQQKVVFAKAMMSNPEVYLCDEPTQAVDIGTRNEIHKLLKDQAKSGVGVIYVTSDLPEMLEIADNILIMANGRTWEQLENKNLTAEEVLKYCYMER